MWRFNMNGVLIQVVPQWMKGSLFMLREDRQYPKLHTGEFIIIGNETNEDLMRAAGFFKGGSSFDYAVPLGHPLYGPDAFTFYSHLGEEWKGVVPETPMKYDTVRHEVTAKVAEHLKTTIAPLVVADVIQQDTYPEIE